MKKPPSSLVVDAYHGSGTRIDQFSYAFTGIGNDQNGSGFYFTTRVDEAMAYCSSTLDGQPKPGGMASPTVHHVRLHLERPLDTQTRGELTRQQVAAFLDRAPDLDYSLSNWGDVSYEGRAAVIARVIDGYVPSDQAAGESARLLTWLHAIANDFFDEDVEGFNRAVRDILGFDSVVEHFEGYGKAHYVAFFPEQIEIVEHVPLAEMAARKEQGIAPSAPEPGL